MKKFVFFLAPLMAISFLTNCGATKYTITVTSEDTSKGTVIGSGTYAYNSSVTIEATPNTGYSFEGWYKDGVKVPSASASYTFTMPANNVSYEARFGKLYTVTVTSEDTFKGTVEGGGLYACGSSVTIRATPNTGYSFEGWYKNGVKVPSASASYTFTMPASSVSYEARFVVKSYTVTVTSEDTSKGTVSCSGTTFAYGSNVTIVATPNTGYSFEGWYKNGVKVPSAPAFYTFTMPASSVSYEARFTIDQYTVTLTPSPSEGGTVKGNGSYDYNKDVTITATANTGYKFNGWYDGKTFISNEPTYNFNMPAKNITYTAKFANENAWFFKTDWWSYCSQATKEDIGQEVNLTVNGQVHKVRLIDVNHDELNDGSGNKAHCTFEFSNLLSDSNGYSLATLWNTSNGKDSTNYDYFNSDLRKALDNQGTGTLRWYQKEAKTKSTDPNYTKPVIEMLPSELKNNIKTVKKQVATTSSYDVKYYDTRVFALTHNEMTQSREEYAKEEGTTYQYYIDHKDDSSRIKHQTKWHKSAVSRLTKITDLDWNPYNYAGYNNSTDSYGGRYWLTSPFVSRINAWRVNDDGHLFFGSVYKHAFAVAPAFCI